MIDRRTLLAAIPALAAWQALAETLATSPPAPSFSELMHMGKDARYQPCYQAILKVDAAGDIGQLRAQVLAICGDAAAARATWRLAMSPPPYPAIDLSDAHADPALDPIVRMSKGRRVVILNEAHHISRSRVFGEQVAMRLRDEGFSLFAAEDFTNTNRRCLPIWSMMVGR